MIRTASCFALLAALGACSKATSEEPARPESPTTTAGAAQPSFTVRSDVFTQGSVIPPRYTCEGDDVSPPLTWSHPPAGTKSFVLVVDDSDASDPRSGERVAHWVMYNLPETARGVPEAQNRAVATARDGENDFGKTQYSGPCPTLGRHHYSFKVYALDQTLPVMNNPHVQDLDRAMRGHIIGRGELVGTYERTQPPAT